MSSEDPEDIHEKFFRELYFFEKQATGIKDDEKRNQVISNIHLIKKLWNER
jgi:hypothetical protein